MYTIDDSSLIKTIYVPKPNLYQWNMMHKENKSSPNYRNQRSSATRLCSLGPTYNKPVDVGWKNGTHINIYTYVYIYTHTYFFDIARVKVWTLDLVVESWTFRPQGSPHGTHAHAHAHIFIYICTNLAFQVNIDPKSIRW